MDLVSCLDKITVESAYGLSYGLEIDSKQVQEISQLQRLGPTHLLFKGYVSFFSWRQSCLGMKLSHLPSSTDITNVRSFIATPSHGFLS
jgi:hypothetical protein